MCECANGRLCTRSYKGSITNCMGKTAIYRTLGATRPNLGATRPRVGICLSRLDALTSKCSSI